MKATDREPLESILTSTAAFSAPEVRVAMELIDIGLTRAGQTDYYFQCIEDDRGLADGDIHARGDVGGGPGLRRVIVHHQQGLELRDGVYQLFDEPQYTRGNLGWNHQASVRGQTTF